MKKLLFITCVISALSASTNLPIRVQIMEKVALALVDKTVINVMIQDEKDLRLVENSKLLSVVNDCEIADIILVRDYDKHKRCKTDGIVFATNYLGYKYTPNVLGAFFYQKGRPNIILKRKQLKRRNIVLPDEYDKYIE